MHWETKASSRAFICFMLCFMKCWSKQVFKVQVFNEYKINVDMNIIQNYSNQFILPPDWELELKFYNANDVSNQLLYRHLYNELDTGISSNVVIGPLTSTEVKLMYPFALMQEIPHIAPLASDEHFRNKEDYKLMLQMSPSNTYQAEAIVDLLCFYEYNQISILAIENDFGLSAAVNMMKHAKMKRLKVNVIHMFKMTKNPSSINLLNVLSRIKLLPPHPIIISSYPEYIPFVLHQARDIGLTIYKRWLVILMDGSIQNFEHGHDMEDMEYFNGIIGIRPMKNAGNLYTNINQSFANTSFIEQKLMDGILAASYGLRNYCQSNDCGEMHIFNNSKLYDCIQKISEDGIATQLNFDDSGAISLKKYDVIFAKVGKWHEIGTWSFADGLNIEIDWIMQYSRLGRRSTDRDDEARHLNKDGNAVIDIVTIVESPFIEFAAESQEVKVKQAYPNRLFSKDIPLNTVKRGMDVLFKGYCMDLIEEISKLGKFKYTVRHVYDKKFGAYDHVSKTWNGMIGDLIRQDADLAVASITVTEERSKVVDFTTDFMDIGLKFILRDSDHTDRYHQYDAFAFLLPFNIDLWHAILASVVCIAVFISLLASLSPYGVRGHFTLSNKADELRIYEKSKGTETKQDLATGQHHEFVNQNNVPAKIKRLQSEKEDAFQGMGISNALYFSWASLFWQSPERVPRSISARFVTAVWYLAAIVFLASYTANMVTFVSQANAWSKSGIYSVTQLVTQTKIPYGTIADSSVEAILKHSNVKVAKGIYDYIVSDSGHLLMPDTQVAMTQVKNGSYILLWDSLALDYAAWESKCELATVDVGFGEVSYAFALQQGSPYKASISRHMLKLRETGFIDNLWAKYFGYLDECAIKNKILHAADGENHRLNYHNLAGIFYLVALAMIIGVFILLMEWLIACFFDVNVNNYNSPHTLYDAFCRRQRRLWHTITESCISLTNMKEKWKPIDLTLDNREILKEKSCHSRTIKLVRGYSSMPDLKFYKDTQPQKKMKRSLSIYETLSDRIPFNKRRRSSIVLINDSKV